MTDEDQPTIGLRVGGWLPPIAGVADGADATAEPTTEESGQAPPQPPGVTRHAHVSQDVRAQRALAGLLAVAVVVAVVIYLIAGSTSGPSRGTSPLAGPSGPGTVAPSPDPSLRPPGSGGFPAAPAQPGRSPSARRAGLGAGRGAAPGGGAPPVITLTQDGVPPVVDLTSTGTIDWVHFGLNGAGPASTDRKNTGSGAIADLGGSARGWYNNNPQRFSWTDGRPTPWMNRTPTGVYVCGTGGSIAVAADAGPGMRTLRLYAGVWRARGQLTVSLSSGSPTATAMLDNRYAISTAVFTVAFQAPAGSRLLLRWTTIASYDPRCGNVDMQAAALN